MINARRQPQICRKAIGNNGWVETECWGSLVCVILPATGVLISVASIHTFTCNSKLLFKKHAVNNDNLNVGTPASLKGLK